MQLGSRSKETLEDLLRRFRGSSGSIVAESDVVQGLGIALGQGIVPGQLIQ